MNFFYSNITFSLNRFGGLLRLAKLTSAIGIGILAAAPSMAKVTIKLDPGITVIAMECRMGQGRYIGNSLTEGTIHGKLLDEGQNQGRLSVYTTNQKPFLNQRALGGGPVLEYSITDDLGKTLVWGVAEIYTDDIGTYPNYIIMTDSSGRFLKLKKTFGHHYWGGYTGIDDRENALVQFLEYVPLSCFAPSSPDAFMRKQ